MNHQALSSPQVSVVIPVYNTEAYLEECLESVLHQTLEDIEVLCVDDGSTDNSAEVVERYAEEDGRLTLIRQENSGAGSARNTGLSRASGRWVYFLDSDDWILPSTLHSLTRKGDHSGAEVVYFEPLNTGRARPFPWQKVRRRELARRTHDGSVYLLKAIRAKAFSFSPCLQIIRRDFLAQTGIVFPTQRIGEDAAFSVEVALAAKVIHYLPEAHFYRRLRPQSLTTGSSSVATIRAALLSYQAIMSMHGRFVHQDAHTAIEILARRLYRFGLHRADQLPAEVMGAIAAFNLVEGEPSLSARFLGSQRKGRLMRQVRRALGGIRGPHEETGT